MFLWFLWVSECIGDIPPKIKHGIYKECKYGAAYHIKDSNDCYPIGWKINCFIITFEEIPWLLEFTFSKIWV